MQQTGLSADVTQAALTVTANDANRTYNGVAYTGGNGVSYSGLVGADSASSLGGTLGYSGASQGSRNAGSYVITPNGLSSGNYAITFANGTLTTDRANLTLSAATDSRVYNGLAGSTAAPSAFGIVAGDSLMALSQSFDSANAGNRTLRVNSGYSLNDGNGGNNYNVNLVSANGTITPASLTITANDATRIYNGTSIGNNAGASYSGFVNSETASVLTGNVSFSNAGARNAGVYTLAASGQSSANYAITYVDGKLTINRAALGLMGQDATRQAGQADPLFAYAVSSGQLFGSDTLSGAAGRAPGEAAGSYALNAGSLANPNYAITFGGGALSITAPPAPPVVIVMPPAPPAPPVVIVMPPAPPAPPVVIVMPPAPAPLSNESQIIAAELGAITPAPAPLEVASAPTSGAANRLASIELVDGSQQIHSIKNRKALYTVEGGGVNVAQ